MTSSTHINLSEVYSGTVQGEGRHAGQLASFVRLAGCNLSCSWCDSAFTWDWTQFDHTAESHPTPIGEVVDRAAACVGRLIFTGGEPLLQHRALARVLEALRGRDLDLETNGTRPLGDTRGLWSHISCSPKVGPSSGQFAAGHLVHPDLLDPSQPVDFKFVIADEPDLVATCQFVTDRGLDPSRVWLMPEGINAPVLSERTPFVAQAAADRGFNFTSRLHVYAWGDERGH